MKKLFILITVLLYGLRSSATILYTDSAYVQKQTAINPDTLQQQLKQTGSDSLKSGIYARIAAYYFQYDTISNKKNRLNYQNQAINYTLQALHLYSKYNDTTGLRTCFNNLAKVYRAQKKYSQAKWFILQSNTLSRTQNDIPNIMTSLIELAGIKMDIKDYDLAMRDLNEALSLSTINHFPRVESAVQENYALLYSRLKDYTKEAIALRRHNLIDDSIRKSEEGQLTAKIHKRDSLQNKKKVFTTVGRKLYKTNYTGRIASL